VPTGVPPDNFLGHLRNGALVRSKRLKQPKTPGWFGGFSEAESSYDADAEGGESGAEGNPESPAMWRESGTETVPGDFPPEWFDESASGGPNSTWQTHYPSLNDVAGMINSKGPDPPWKKSAQGRWQQQYKPPVFSGASSRSLAKDAAWFDTGVDQYDAYGRIREPLSYSGRRYAEWEPVTKNVTLKCADAGCTANATEQIYQPGSEAICSMTFSVHPTDFDDDYSKETVDWIMVNNKTVNTKCDPKAKGCGQNNVDPRALFPCVLDQDVSQLISEGNGTVSLSAKISSMVDECALDGMLLSAVANISCMVRKIITTTPEPVPGPDGIKLGQKSATVPLQCRNPGCIATATVKLNKTAINGSTCSLKVKVNQTDFDETHGTVEKVEWIKVDGLNATTDCKPGNNHCQDVANTTTAASTTKAASSMLQLSQPDATLPLSNATGIDAFACLENHDVTAAAEDGEFVVTAKISDMVDECASQGYLLDGLVEVVCIGPETTPTPSTTTTVPS